MPKFKGKINSWADYVSPRYQKRRHEKKTQLDREMLERYEHKEEVSIAWEEMGCGKHGTPTLMW